MGVPAVLLGDCHTSLTSRSHNLAAFQASDFQARLLVFHFFLPGRWVRSQARGHVDLTRSREMGCRGDRHPGKTSFPGSAGLGFASEACIFS